MQIERYTINRDSPTTEIRMRQSTNGILLILFATGVEIAVWWFGPYGNTPIIPPTFAWLVTILFAAVILGAIVSIFYTEEYLVTADRIEYRGSFGQRATLVYGNTIHAQLRVATAKARRSGTRVFPYELIFLNENGATTPIQFTFQSRHAADNFIAAITPRLPLAIVEVADGWA